MARLEPKKKRIHQRSVTMDENVLRIEDRPGGLDGVRRLVLNRPEKRNALNGELLSALLSALEEADHDPCVRCLILQGEGDKAFCAGGDLAGNLGGDGFLAMHYERGQFADLLRCFRRLRTPVIAAVNGYALGGGFGLLLSCDLAIAVDDASMGTPEIKRGLFPMMIARLVYENLPQKAANKLVLLGEKTSGQSAVDLGIVNEAVPRKAFAEKVLEYAEQLASLSPAVLGLGRRAVYRQLDLSFDDALAFLQDQLTLNLQTEDAAEGITAFFGKRDPEWKGR